MTPTTRRILIYWLLLLVPTLAVGVGAVQLLKREQERIAQQSAEAYESRQAALAARTRLIVENVELLVGDVQEGLLDALAEPDDGEMDSFLADWEADNPLVRSTFLAGENGMLLRPDARTSGEVERGFARRFGSTLRQNPPWQTSAPAAPATVEKTEEVELKARGDVAANVAQVQSARRDVQQLLKPRSYASTRPAPAAAADLAGAEMELRERRAEAQRASRAQTTTAEREARARQMPPRVVEPRGWLAQTIDGRLHVLGWVQPRAGALIRGVELDVSGLVSRLGSALPAEVEMGEGFVLRDGEGRVAHQAGKMTREGEAAVRVPLSVALLPGWEVAAFLAAPVYSSGNGAAFFWVGSLLVAIFLAAILTGGSLLLWQARRSEAEAAQKTSFVANVSHEFKTPLTTIRLYTELLEQGRVRDAAQGGEYLRTIGRETQRLARLVNNALDFSRLEQGRKRFSREEVDLSATVTRVLETQAPRLVEANLRLVRNLPEEAVVAKTDRDAVEQIVLNLLDNACKYAGEGGEIMVTLNARASGGAEVRVADRGSGVPVAHRERIFEKFHRVDDSLTAEKAGAGLGLSIARQLARGLGGGLRYAERAGGGAEFILELP